MKEIKKLLEANTAGGRRRVSEVFRDFVELSAITFRNSADRLGRDAREQRYLEIVGRYDTDEVHRFPTMLALLVRQLTDGFGDALGELYMSLDLGNDRLGQFFTPYDVSRLTVSLSIGEMAAVLEQQDFIALQEPACGSGGMIVAAAEALRDQGVNYQRRMHVTATDLDATAVHMTYVQCTLLHIPARIVHGNTLSQEVHDVWPTPAHVLGGWDRKLNAANHAGAEQSDPAEELYVEPEMPAA